MPKRSPRTAKTVSERPPGQRARFYDASALAKAYLSEPGTVDVRRWIAQGHAVASRLSEIEVPSAIIRRWREGLLTAAARDAAIDAFRADAHRRDLVEPTGEVARRAVALLSSHRLRAGDAVQLASAMVARAEPGSGVQRFVAYDARLLDAARAEGFITEEY